MKTDTKENPNPIGTPNKEKLTLQQKLSCITSEIGPIKKTKRPGDTVSFKYRSIDDVQNHLNPLLAEYGITLQSKVLKCDLTMREFEKNQVKKIAYTAVIHMQLIFSDGKDIETWEEVSMSEDYADKAVTQAMSMAYKYSLLRKFCIATEDLTDPDSRQPEHRDIEEERKPSPTAWLNEGTPEWDEVAEKLGSKEWTLDDVKARWKVNKRQEPELLTMIGKPATKNAAPLLLKKSVKQELNAEIKRNCEDIEMACAGNSSMLAAELDKDKLAKAYYNSELKLRNGSVSLKLVQDTYNLDEEVLKHFTSISKK